MSEASSVVTEDLLESLADIFHKILSDEWTRVKLPYGLAAAFKHARGSPSHSTEHIFLSEGFTTWVAYFLALPRRGHFRGRTAQNRALKEMENLPTEARRRLARKVAKMTPHNTARQVIEQFEHKLRRLRGHANKGTATQVMRQAPAERESAERLPDIGCPPGSRAMVHVRSNACPQATIDMFPAYLGSAIQRIRQDQQWFTAVEMLFPVWPGEQKIICAMQLQILGNKVERLAMELFGACIEVSGRQRYLLLHNGMKIEPGPEITLRGCETGTISKVLGPEIATAAMASDFFREEMRTGSLRTQCVSMRVTAKPDDMAIITVALGLQEGLSLGKKLQLSTSEATEQAANSYFFSDTFPPTPAK